MTSLFGTLCDADRLREPDGRDGSARLTSAYVLSIDCCFPPARRVSDKYLCRNFALLDNDRVLDLY